MGKGAISNEKIDEITICTIRATENKDGLPYMFELINPYESVKRVERAMSMGYLLIVVDTETIRYVINNLVNCSCLSYSPKKHSCSGCSSNFSKEITALEFLKGVK